MLRRTFLLLLALMALSVAVRAAAAPPVDRNTRHITRAEAVALLVSAQANLHSRVAWYQQHMPPMPLFVDARQTDWFTPYLEVAFEQGLILGNRARRFRPMEMLRVEEAVMLVTRMKEARSDAPVLYLPGSDHRWFSAPLQAALSEGIPLPHPLTVGHPIERRDFYAMLPVVGIVYPEAVAFVDPPAPPGLPPARRIVIRPLRLQGATGQSAVQAVTAGIGRTLASFRISLPTLGISDLAVNHPSDPFSHNGLLAPLRDGVGHLFSYPGTNGKIVIYGHSSGYPWDISRYTKIFRQINRLHPGDRVEVAYNGTTHVYEVTFKESVPAGDMNAYRNGGEEELILYTCWPPDSIRERYLVHAKPVEKIAAR